MFIVFYDYLTIASSLVILKCIDNIILPINSFQIPFKVLSNSYQRLSLYTHPVFIVYSLYIQEYTVNVRRVQNICSMTDFDTTLIRL